MLPLGYLQHDAERDAVLTFPADAVRLLHIGAPAVDAADAAGCAQDRHARAARGGQLGDVLEANGASACSIVSAAAVWPQALCCSSVN